MSILAIVFPVFCIIGLGYLFASIKKVDLKSIIDVLLYLTIPALVVSSLTKKSYLPGDLAEIAAAVAGVVLATGLIACAYLTLRKKRGLRGFYLPTMFMNSGNMGFPLAFLAFGPDGLAVAVLYFIVISLLVHTLGVYIAKGSGGGFKEIFKLPLIYASLVGLALNFTGTKLPEPVSTTLDMLGAATIPLMQISLGCHLYQVRLTDLGASLAGSVIRIGGGFAAALIVTSLLGIDGVERSVIILSSSMPAGVINFIMSHRYDVQSGLVASVVAMSTLLSVASTPLVLIFIRGF